MQDVFWQQDDFPFFQRVCYAANYHGRLSFEALEVCIARCFVRRDFLAFQQSKQKEAKTILPEQYLTIEFFGAEIKLVSQRNSRSTRFGFRLCGWQISIYKHNFLMINDKWSRMSSMTVQPCFWHR